MLRVSPARVFLEPTTSNLHGGPSTWLTIILLELQICRSVLLCLFMGLEPLFWIFPTEHNAGTRIDSEVRHEIPSCFDPLTKRALPLIGSSFWPIILFFLIVRSRSFAGILQLFWAKAQLNKFFERKGLRWLSSSHVFEMKRRIVLHIVLF